MSPEDLSKESISTGMPRCITSISCKVRSGCSFVTLIFFYETTRDVVQTVFAFDNAVRGVEAGR